MDLSDEIDIKIVENFFLPYLIFTQKMINMISYVFFILFLTRVPKVQFDSVIIIFHLELFTDCDNYLRNVM